MPTINLDDDELATVIAAVRRVIETDRFPRAPRVDALRSALVKLDQPPPSPTQPASKADKRSRRSVRLFPGADQPLDRPSAPVVARNRG